MNCKLSETIRSLRLQHRWTQEQLADRLGVSYQSVSRWENSITYPDIELLPALARCFSVSVDTLLGGEDADKAQDLRNAVSGIAAMEDADRDTLIELIRACRREQHSNALFEDICEALRYSPLCQDGDVLTELRKTATLFFETCTDASLRSRVLGRYACLEDDRHVGTLLERYASEQSTAKDYLLKERYLFRDEYERFESARQRYFHKQIVNLIDGDAALWRDASKPMEAHHSRLENDTKLAFLHALCQETPTATHPITCGRRPDLFAEQRIFIGSRQACAYAALGNIDEAFAVLEDVVGLIETVAALPDGAVLSCESPALSTLTLTVKEESMGCLGRAKVLYYTLENGEHEQLDAIIPKSEWECLTTAEYARWGWLAPIRKDKRFVDLTERLKALL